MEVLQAKYEQMLQDEKIAREQEKEVREMHHETCQSTLKQWNNSLVFLLSTQPNRSEK